MSKKKKGEPGRERSMREQEISIKPESRPEFILRLIGWPKPIGWPLTIDELEAISPAEAIERAEQERRKPTPGKLLAWHEQRMVAAVKKANALSDPEAREQLLHEAWQGSRHDVNEALASAYIRERISAPTRPTSRKLSASRFLTGEDPDRDAALKWLKEGEEMPDLDLANSLEDEDLRLAVLFMQLDIKGRDFKIKDLGPKAKIGDRVIGGGKLGGKTKAEMRAVERQYWEKTIRAVYQAHPKVYFHSYRKEAQDLIRKYREVKGSGVSDRELRRVILPKLIPELFPNLLRRSPRSSSA